MVRERGLYSHMWGRVAGAWSAAVLLWMPIMPGCSLQGASPSPGPRNSQQAAAYVAFLPQVKPHSAASGWLGLQTAAHCLATGQPLPVAAVAPPALPPAPPAPAPTPLATAAMHLRPSGIPASTVAAPMPAPRPGPPPANLNGGSGSWAGHTTPAQQLASLQQGEQPG